MTSLRPCFICSCDNHSLNPPGGFDCGFCGNHGGIGLTSISNGLVVLLLADVFRTHKRNVTFYRQMRDGGGGFTFRQFAGNDSNLLIVFYVQIMPDDFVMQLHRF